MSELTNVLAGACQLTHCARAGRVARRQNTTFSPPDPEGEKMIRKIRKQLRKSRGFTLVELMIVVAIVGILAALAIYGVRKYMSNAKSAEARNSIGQMGKDAITAYFKEGMDASVLALGASTSVVNQLCDGSNVEAVPNKGNISQSSMPAQIKAKKYQSAPAEWKSWDCLHFSMNDPQYYQYDYVSPGGATAGTTFQCQAAGDLNGDGLGSLFTMSGAIQTKDNILTATLAPNMTENAPDE